MIHFKSNHRLQQVITPHMSSVLCHQQILQQHKNHHMQTSGHHLLQQPNLKKKMMNGRVRHHALTFKMVWYAIKRNDVHVQLSKLNKYKNNTKLNPTSHKRSCLNNITENIISYSCQAVCFKTQKSNLNVKHKKTKPLWTQFYNQNRTMPYQLQRLTMTHFKCLGVSSVTLFIHSNYFMHSYFRNILFNTCTKNN